MPFVSLGLVPEFASSLIVPQLVGNARAAEKLLLGDPFSADAVEMGIANAVLPAAEVVPHARRIAERFNALPPGAARDQAADATVARRRRRRGDRRRERRLAARLRSPEAKKPSVPSSRSASPTSRSSESGRSGPFAAGEPRLAHPALALAFKLALAPLLVARAVRTDAAPRLARGDRSARGRSGTGGGPPMLASGRRFVGGGRRRRASGSIGRRLPGSNAGGASGRADRVAPARPLRPQYARGPCDAARRAARPGRRRRRGHRRQRRDRPGPGPGARPPRRARRLAARPGARAPRGLLRRCRRCRFPLLPEPLRASRIGADARRHDRALARWGATRRRLGRGDRDRSDAGDDGERRLSSRRAGLPRLRRGRSACMWHAASADRRR